VSVQDRGTVCAKRTVGSKIVLDAPDGTPRLQAQLETFSVHLEIVLILTQDSCSICTERAIGSKVIFDRTDELGDVGHLESRFGPFGDGVSVGATWFMPTVPHAQKLF
jgi:hypothetical protein